jgi:acetyltransferase-like isoleucine patch superfamily enzyme
MDTRMGGKDLARESGGSAPSRGGLMASVTARLYNQLGERMRRYPLGYRLRGMWFARSFTSAGWLACSPGLPWPRVRNLGGKVEAGNCLFYSGVRLEVGRGARLIIGSGTFMNRNVEVIAWEEITIGERCMIGWDVVILDTDQHALPGRPMTNMPVHVGDGVWIGARAMILKGVTIGDGAVIGAGAIVTHDVPAGAIVTGPAAAVRHRTTPDAATAGDAPRPG